MVKASQTLQAARKRVFRLMHIVRALTIILIALRLPATNAVAADLGVPISPPLALNTNAAGDSGRDRNVRLAVDNAGHWVAVWQSDENLNGSLGGDDEIFVARSSDRGNTWTDPAALNTNAGIDPKKDDLSPCIVTDGLGTWLAAWESDAAINGSNGADKDIIYACSADNGLTWTAPLNLNANSIIDGHNDSDIEIETDGAGTWIAVWRTLDTLSGQIGPDANILIARSVNNGVSWSYPVPLNINAPTDTGQDIEPHLATDGQGHWIVVWQSNERLVNTVGPDFEVFVSRSADNGLVWSFPVALNSNAPGDVGDDLDPQITTDRNGTWIVVWSSNGNTTLTDRDILFSRSVNNGAGWTPSAALNTNAAGDAGADQAVQIITDRQGQWLALWSSSDTLGGTIGTDLDILVSRSSNNGTTWLEPSALNTNASATTGPNEIPCIATDRAGAWVAAWETRDSLNGTIETEGDILKARFALPDCNQNMIPDSIEPDANQNGIPDNCETIACRADIAPPPNGNGIVNVDDLLSIINSWGPCAAPPALCRADIAPSPIGNGTVNVDDLLAIINAWGPCP